MIDTGEIPTGRECPRCGYPTVYELGTEVCYNCGWCVDDEEDKSE